MPSVPWQWTATYLSRAAAVSTTVRSSSSVVIRLPGTLPSLRKAPDTMYLTKSHPCAISSRTAPMTASRPSASLYMRLQASLPASLGEIISPAL